MANRPKKRKEPDAGDDGSPLSPTKKMKMEELVNVSRTGRQRKKSAKVLEMEAEAEQLEQVLRARVESDDANRPRPPMFKGPRPKKVAPKVGADTEEEDPADSDSDYSETPHQPAANETVSKSGRVRKKSAKLLEMVEVEELDRKIFRSSDIPKSIRIAPLQPPPSPHPVKKPKTPVPSVGGSTSSTPGSPPATPGGSTIKLLLNSPKKSVGAGSPPEPILSTLGASLGSPTKTSPQPPPPPPPPPPQTPPPQVQPTPGSPQTPKEPFKVKFLADSPDVILPPKPSKKKAKKEAASKSLVVTTEEKSPVKSVVPKLKMMLSPKEKSPGDAAAIMADQPLLSKMMGEVGQAPIGPPPPSSAEAKSLKKKARKEAKEASQGEKKKKCKVKESGGAGVAAVLSFPPPASSTLAQHLMAEPAIPVLPALIETSMDDDDGENPLRIDTPKEPKKKKSSKEKEKKPKALKSPKGAKKQTILEVPTLNPGSAAAEFPLKMESEGNEAGPSYANTNEMANKVKTSQERKANKDKKKRGKGKEDPEKPKKRRAPTAYMLWCNSHRAKLVQDSPGIDFATISRRLGEMWQGQTGKEKMAWKRRAKKLAAKGSTLISTGKGAAKIAHASQTQTKGSSSKSTSGHSKTTGSTSGPATAGTGQQRTGHSESGASPAKTAGCTGALDIAAHLKLLGESLSIIGARLQEHHGQIAVQGTLPVLLDSLLCALGPLTCLTNHIPELDGASLSTHTQTLDNIAYIMPGIG